MGKNEDKDSYETSIRSVSRRTREALLSAWNEQMDLSIKDLEIIASDTDNRKPLEIIVAKTLLKHCSQGMNFSDLLDRIDPMPQQHHIQQFMSTISGEDLQKMKD